MVLRFIGKQVIPWHHFPKSVMVWARITSMGKTPLVFVERGVKINAQIYQDRILREVVKLWAQRHFKNHCWTFQQDWAPAHGAQSMMEFCKANFPTTWGKELWPSNLPDLNPMDFSIWGILESRACSTKHTTIEGLKKSLQQAWDTITKNELSSIIKNFSKRLRACVAAKGDHFEHLL